MNYVPDMPEKEDKQPVCFWRGKIMYENMEEMQVLAHADDLLERLRGNLAEKERFKALADERVKAINRQLELRTSKLDERIEGCKEELLHIVKISTTKETETQHKLELLGGDVIIKKATKKFKNDNKAILEAIKNERKDLVKERVTTSLDWAKFKKELEIIGDGTDTEIINTTTGEVVNIAGLEVEDVPERLEVK